MERIATILGGLPVVADVSFGKDADTPDGPGEYWSAVNALYWCKRDGTKGKEIPEHLRDRAERYDPYFWNLLEGICEELAYEASEQRRIASGEPEMVPFDTELRFHEDGREAGRAEEAPADAA